MGEDSKSARTQIIIALIGLAGVLGTALITQWKTIFPSPSQDNPGIAQKTAPPAETKKTDNGQDAAGIAQKPPPPHEPTVADAERLTENYIAALKKGDADPVVGMTSVPFFFGKQLLSSKDDIRTAYVS